MDIINVSDQELLDMYNMWNSYYIMIEEKYPVRKLSIEFTFDEIMLEINRKRDCNQWTLEYKG